MREEGRIDRSSHRWRDAVAAGLPDSSVLRLALSELEGAGGGGRRRGGGGLVPCRACMRRLAGVTIEEFGSGTGGGRYMVGFTSLCFFGHDMSFGWAPGPLGKPWLAGLGIFGLLHSPRLTREQLASWLGSARYSYQAKN
jgi:hypothetical protein